MKTVIVKSSTVDSGWTENCAGMMTSATVHVHAKLAGVGSGLSIVIECCLRMRTAVVRLMTDNADGLIERNVTS